MKKLITALGAFLFLLVLIMVIYTMRGRSAREMELTNAMKSSMEKTMDMRNAEWAYAPKDDEEFVALFLETLGTQIESNSQLTVHILEADLEKGILSAEAILQFKHPIGTMGRVSCTRTIIADQTGSLSSDSVKITFLVEGKVYKAYIIPKGDSCRNPAAPEITGKEFAGWKDTEGNISMDLSSLSVTEDMTLYAVFD